MKWIGFMGLVAASLGPGIDAGAEASQVGPRVGDIYEITINRESSGQDSDGSSSSSRGRDTIVERVIGVRADGLELEYDLPGGIPAEERASEWQFPVRVFKPHRGPLQLLNRAELEARVDAWLRAAGLPREACGHWYFTWNAFQVECDPQSVVETLEYIDLSSTDLGDGILYRDPTARAPAPMARRTAGPDGATFAVETEVDPDAVRRGRAESDLVVAEIVGEPTTLEAALRERAREAVSGTISVTFETDSAGNVRRRTRVTRLETRKPDGQTESETVTETVERRPVSRPGS